MKWKSLSLIGKNDINKQQVLIHVLNKGSGKFSAQFNKKFLRLTEPSTYLEKIYLKHVVAANSKLEERQLNKERVCVRNWFQSNKWRALNYIIWRCILLDNLIWHPDTIKSRVNVNIREASRPSPMFLRKVFEDSF